MNKLTKQQKQGAQQKNVFTKIQIPISIEEYNNILEKPVISKLFNNPNLKNFLPNLEKYCCFKLKYKTVNILSFHKSKTKLFENKILQIN